MDDLSNNNAPLFHTVIDIGTKAPRDQIFTILDLVSDGYTSASVSPIADGFRLDLFSIDEKIDEKDAKEFSTHLTDMAEAYSITDIHIKESTVKPVQDKNWLEEVFVAFKPMDIGLFHVFGSHYKDQIETDLIPLQIDAATAFGSGEHATTHLCLEALSQLKDEIDPENILDMGCGSGILAIAAQKLWPDAKIYGVDIDAESIRVAKHHAKINETPKISFLADDGYQSPLVQKNQPFDLVLANILAGPLIEMAPDAAQAVVDKGHIILSGLLATQKESVLEAHKKQSFGFINSFEKDEWCCLKLNRKAL